jgi:mRNA interferase MazF
LITNSSIPKRGDIWLTNFDPTVGAEIKKVRPAIIVSSDGVGKLPIKLIAPITDWKEYYSGNIWHVKIEALRGVDVQRLIRKIGECSSEIMEEIAAAIAVVVEYNE